MLARRRWALAVVSLVAVSAFAGPASPKPKKLKGEPRALADIEAKAKALEKSKDPAGDFDALTEFLGVSSVFCAPEACKSITHVKWLTGNLDADADSEKVLAITARGGGECAPTNLDVFVLDATSKTEFKVVAHTRQSFDAGKDPIAEASLAKVHSSAVDDLVVRVDAQCQKSPREHVLRVHTLESGRLEEIASSADLLGKDLLSHAFVGSAPVTLELASAKGKTKLTFDPAHGYDSFPSVETAKKTAITKSDDDSLGANECAAPLGTNLASDCDLSGTAKVEVLVQNGKALGMTVTVTPASLSTTRCLRQKVAAASWKSAPGVTGCTRTFTVK